MNRMSYSPAFGQSPKPCLHSWRPAVLQSPFLHHHISHTIQSDARLRLAGPSSTRLIKEVTDGE